MAESERARESRRFSAQKVSRMACDQLAIQLGALRDAGMLGHGAFQTRPMGEDGGVRLTLSEWDPGQRGYGSDACVELRWSTLRWRFLRRWSARARARLFGQQSLVDSVCKRALRAVARVEERKRAMTGKASPPGLAAAIEAAEIGASAKEAPASAPARRL